MNMDFENFLVIITLITGLIALLDKLVWSKKRQAVSAEKVPFWIAQSKSFFPILLIVLLLRGFLFEPFRIPTGSLEPTLAIGDFIVVNKFVYGLRLPMVYKKIVSIQEPKRGDIVVFRHPTEHVDYIKRVIGLPGDHVSYIDKVLYINGRAMPQVFKGYAIEQDSEGNESPVIEKEENLDGVYHRIFLKKDVSMLDSSLLLPQSSWIVPDGQYFMMGDNRDDSLDSRYWGFVPEDHIKGKAVMVWLSWDNQAHRIRWERVGKKVG